MKTKYLFFSIILLSLSISTIYAQDITSTYSKKIDSLQQLIDSHSKYDEEKVRLLNEYARASFYGLEFYQGLIATREARLLSEELNFKGGKIMYYLTLSVFHGDGSMANYYQKQAEWLSKNPDHELGQYYVSLQNKEHDIGTEWKKLISQFTKIYQHFEKLDDKEIQANLLDFISGFYFWEGDFEKSLQCQETGIELFRDLGQVYPVFQTTAYKMYNLQRLGKEDDIKKVEAELIDFVTQNENENNFGLISATMANGYRFSGRYALAIEYYLKSISIFEQNKDINMLVDTYEDIANAYRNIVMYDKAVAIYEKLIPLLNQQNNTNNIFNIYSQASFSNYYVKNYEKAREYMALSLQVPNAQTRNYYLARQNSLEGQILKDEQQYSLAIQYLQKALASYIALGKKNGNPFMAMYTAECYQAMGDYPKALKHALLGLQMEKELSLVRTKVESEISLMLSEIYEALGQRDKAYEHLRRYQEIRAENDKLDAANRLADAEIRDILEKSQLKINQAEQERLLTDQENRVQKIWIFSIVGALLSALLLVFILYRNNKTKQKANTLLKVQKEEIQTTLEQLEATQKQLIQSEKMASLGELTAGIAHEIQNPLNFVNNFSEVSNELIDEMNEELDKGDTVEAKTIASEIKQNLEKINHHGKRADGIVKSMLQHSRTSTGIKEPTDINALTDEYLRLAYHGLRARDKSFNATMETDYDTTVGNIQITPQDMGRVILNIITNAFYAINDKKKQLINNSADNSYQPTVWVSTKKEKDNILISVKDNGNGIPQKAIDKIFQPFFTTKPTGEGTGLGLSMSYDIVKMHGGKLIVKTEAEKGTVFTIQLPVKIKDK
ncbi:ATP-binding protein [Algibacter mikhailovii]|uniref:ATP-binding protein n=1 Tax=Algibacter mikhailovii TaxID=425498 RepID=UPI0024949FB4|nr:ATP-binding protein [Algibacter mikhailovii]